MTCERERDPLLPMDATYTWVRILVRKSHVPSGFHLGISSWGGGGGELADHVVVRPWRGEGRLHIYNILRGKLGQFGGKLSCFGGKLLLSPPP